MIQIINKRAKFDYIFQYGYTSGIKLKGVEVKSIRDSGASFDGAYCFIDTHNEIYLTGLNIPCNKDTKPMFKLLLKKREIKHLKNALIKGTTLIPYKLFEQKNGLFKIDLQLSKGKNTHDKRETIKKRDYERNKNISDNV